jgi:hypothetical protein
MSDNPDLTLLGVQVKAMQSDLRAIKRDMAMLRAQQSELPSIAQFQAGLSAIDARMTELADETNGLVRDLTDLIKAKLP